MLKSTKTSSEKCKLCIATLQVTSKPFCLASFMISRDLDEDIVGICNLPPVYSKIAKSRATITSSARVGIPFRPNFVEVMCSFTTPFPAILFSLAKEIIIPSKGCTYCNAIFSKLALFNDFL